MVNAIQAEFQVRAVDKASLAGTPLEPWLQRVQERN